ncbi:HlyD family efflux transporter periplasmic adaptor subunit [Oscillatoria sp. CS-180]|uniref:HlyD family efflux transporter periplasmic adaptor subunit n=1 Tax=Oscillatoria sp. CS-180 TaxID=3021720 RepID=UPI00232DC740|nr:HlyD family efflux transporter periplasmic adaptor subunit [Oscillatoria sp. CS-180]MDB9525037.1 HlyD family efflux transporter periplasmic adaptor subunit [Oscillatoria sp. CS-180]
MTPGSRITQNGHAQNGRLGNGRLQNGRPAQHGRLLQDGQSPPPPPQPPQHQPTGPNFERPVILRQSPRWARYVVWGIVGVTVTSVTWACLAKIEEAIPAQGKLEPSGVVQPVQAPVGGVVEDIRITEGETVQQGDILVTMDPSSTRAQLESLEDVRDSLMEESEFYRSQLSAAPEVEGAPTTVSPEVARLTSNRVALIEENELYRAILRGDITATNLSPQQRERVQTSLGDVNSQIAINQLQIEQLNEQLEQVQTQLANAIEALRVEQEILGSISPLVEQGGISKLQGLRQEQEVNNRQTEVNSLRDEQQRLILAIDQAREELRRTSVVSNEEMLDRIAANDNQLANIDSQLTKIVVDNEKQLEEIEGQINQLEYALENQELKAPLTGQVFNLKANQPGYVANATEPILEIVPDGTLVARVFITNRDIGFVTQQFYEQDEPLKVDVRIDSFPFSEFGDVEGTVIHIGSDALPPDEINPFYRFPAEIELESQELGEALPLQSGMSVTANIKLRKRRVITILSDLFVRKIDSLRSGG